MRTRALLPLITHAAVCTVLGGAFLWFGASQLGGLGKLGPVSPFHTTDRYLRPIIGDPAGSEHLLQLLATLPETKPVAIVYRLDNDSDTMLAYVVSYFAWPRPVTSLPVDRNNAMSQLQLLRDAEVSATFYCGVLPPPNAQSLIRIGSGLIMEPRGKSEGKTP